MTRNAGWMVAVALSVLPGAAQAQSDQMQHPAPTTAQAAPSTANGSEVVWLRQRVEQLEAQLAAGGGACSPEAKAKIKRKKDRSMSGSMADDKMGAGATGSMPMSDSPMGKMPMNDHPMGKMKPKKDSSMKPGSMGDDNTGGDHM